MAKMPNEVEIKPTPTTKDSKCLNNTTPPMQPLGEVKITSPVIVMPECSRTTRSSSSNSASSDTPATHTGSSWDTDREESNILEEPNNLSRITLTSESSQFL